MDKVKVSIQGQSGSYHDIAARKFFGQEISVLGRENFRDVFCDVREGHADFAVAAIENSLYGSINQVYDLLLSNKSYIVAEIYLHIHHCLAGIRGADIAKLKEVHSHIAALEQCSDFLNYEIPYAKQVVKNDTAGSARELMELGDRAKAAILNAETAEKLGMEVLARNIETNHHNYTRFIVVSNNPKPLDKTQDKTSIVIQTAGSHADDDQKPGALYRALECFAKRKINLSKLESRPIVGKAWHYMFYIDFEAALHLKKSQDAIRELQEIGCDIRIFGSYAKGKLLSSEQESKNHKKTSAKV